MKIKRQKAKTKFVIKKKLKFQDYRIFLEAAEIETNINHLEKSKTDIDCLKKDKKEFIKNNKLIKDLEQRFRSEKHNIFTKEINNIALNLNDNKKCNKVIR